MNRDEERRKVFSLCYGQQRKRKLSCSKQLQLRAFRALFQSLTCPGMCFHTKTCSGLAPQHFPIPFIPCMHFQIFIFPSVTSSKQDSLTGQQFRSRYIFLWIHWKKFLLESGAIAVIWLRCPGSIRRGVYFNRCILHASCIKGPRTTKAKHETQSGSDMEGSASAQDTKKQK